MSRPYISLPTGLGGWAFVISVLAACAIAAAYLQEAVTNWNLLDMSAYQAAALRIRDGETLYGGDVHSNNAYRYAPWFAYAWVALTYLPETLVRVGWSVILLVGSGMAIRPLLQRSRPHLVLALLFIPLMLGSASGGNVQPVMIGVLVWGLSTRWGWLAVAFAASLKVVPIAFCAVFIAQRRWAQVAAAVALTAVLWLPITWMPVEPVTFETGLARELPTPLWMLVPAIAGLLALGVAWRRSPYTPLAAAIAAAAALPRFFAYELSIILPAVPDRRRR